MRGRTQRESKKRYLIEGAIMVLVKNMALGKFPQIHRMTSGKTLSNTSEDT